MENMTQSEQLAEKIKAHLAAGGIVRLATCYQAMFIKAKHVNLVIGSKRENDNGVYIQSGKSKTFWMANYIAFSNELPSLR